MKKKLIPILFAYIPAGFVMTSIVLVIILRWIPVPFTPLMVKRALRTMGDKAISVQYNWTPLNNVSEVMIEAVIAAEDGRFYSHNGFDFKELRRMQEKHLFDGSPVRGCSTISQQTAKNCFTWCTNTWFRKGLEAYFTVLIERLWGKQRILEVYLNVAEMGPGIYGTQAAARRYFNIDASELSLADASSLVCCLPNPLHRNPNWVNQYMPGRRAQIANLTSTRVYLIDYKK